MATLRDIKNRIVGVKSTQKITKAMKMIATAKLRGAQQRIVGARPYANKIGEMLSRLAADDSLQTNPFFKARDSKKNMCSCYYCGQRLVWCIQYKHYQGSNKLYQ